MKPKKFYRIFKCLIILLVLSGNIGTASAVDDTQLQWGTGVSGTLLRGETISYMGFTVKVTGFSAPVESGGAGEEVVPFVALNISRNGTFIGSAALLQGDSYIDPEGELKITAEELPSKDSPDWLYESYAPWVVLDLSPRGTPFLEVSVETDYDEYTSSSATDIIATVTLTNSGMADAVDLDLKIVTQLGIKRGELKYHFDKVSKGESIVKELVFSSPIISQLKTYDILANASGDDVKGLSYCAQALKSIIIAPEAQPMPSLKKSTSGKIYLKDYIMVSLSLKNNGKNELKNVSITDAVPASFKMIGNNSLKWLTNIGPYGEWEARYLLKPIEASNEGFVLPSALAEFTLDNEYFLIPSNRPEITVYGPRVMLTKETDKSEIVPGDTITLTIVAQNYGNTPTKVMITDKLPEHSTVISGSTYYEDFLEANKVVSFSYTLKLDSETPTRLPAAIAEYYELGTKGGLISTASRELELRIKAPPPAPTIPVETVEEETPDIESTEQPVPVETEIMEPAPEEIVEIPSEINKSVSPEPPADTKSVLNMLLGCDDKNNSGFANEACNFLIVSNQT